MVSGGGRGGTNVDDFNASGKTVYGAVRYKASPPRVYRRITVMAAAKPIAHCVASSCECVRVCVYTAATVHINKNGTDEKKK